MATANLELGGSEEKEARNWSAPSAKRKKVRDELLTQQNHSAFICFICLRSWLRFHPKRGFYGKHKFENHCSYHQVKLWEIFLKQYLVI